MHHITNYTQTIRMNTVPRDWTGADLRLMFADITNDNAADQTLSVISGTVQQRTKRIQCTPAVWNEMRTAFPDRATTPFRILEHVAA